MKKLYFFLGFLLAVNMGWGQSIFSNPVTGTNPNTANPYIDNQSVNANITVSGIGRGSGINGNAANNRYNARDWSSSFDANDYFYFTITPNPGYEIDFVSLVYKAQISSTGPTNVVFRSSIDGFTTDIATPSIANSGSEVSPPTISLAAFQNITSAITFRFYGWGGNNAAGTFSINEFTFNGAVSLLPVNSITAGLVSAPPFCVTGSNDAAGTVAFTSTGTFSGQTFTAMLSDATGSFASPVNIGTTTVTGTNPSGAINITIPAGTVSGTGYKIRIDESTNITGTASAAFAVVNGVTNVTGAGAAPGNGQATVSWTNPAGCYDEILIVAADASNTGIPTGDGSSYIADLVFAIGSVLNNGYVVYNGNSSPQTFAGLTNGTTYYFKIFTRLGTTWSSGVEVSVVPQLVTSATDYFRSVASGNWNAASSWESSPDGLTWIPATLTPTSAANTITIRNGHTITLTATTTVDQLVIDAGGQLTIASAVTWTLANGAGTDLSNSGILLNQGGTWTISSGANWQVNAGGTHIHNTTSAIAAPLNAATLDAASNFIYRGSSTLSPSFALSGRTFGNLAFESTAGIMTLNGTGGSALSVNGNLTVGPNCNIGIGMTGTPGHSVKGDISIGTGATLNFNPASAGTFNLNGSSAQTINNSGTLTFGTNQSITINNPGGVVTNTNIVLSASAVLTLTSGKLSLGNNNLTATTISGGNASGYIQTDGSGTVTVNNIGASLKTFPVGNSTYNPVTIANGSNLNWTVRVEDNLMVDNPVFAGNITKAVQRTWYITPATNPPPSGADITFQYDDGDNSQIGTLFDINSNVHVWHKVDNEWISTGGQIVPAGTPGGVRTVSVNNWSQFSPFAISILDGPLPVYFTDVKATEQGPGILISWSNLTEKNVQHYVVEHSVNGNGFTDMAAVNARSNNGGREDYNYFHASPANGINYYRIRSVEFNSAGKQSIVVKVDTRKGQTGIVIYPNPANGKNISLQVTDLSKGQYSISVFSAGGQLIAKQTLMHNGGSVTEPVALPASVSSGIYTIVISNEGMKMIRQFVIR